MRDLDETDLRILNILQTNSDITTKELALKVNLSPTPVFERVKRIEKAGYITKYVAILNAEKLSRGFIVFCNISLKQHSKELGLQFMSSIEDINAITECYNISGDYDFMLKIHVENMPHYQDFVLNTLGKIDNIGSLQSLFVMGEIKHTYAIPLVPNK